MAKIDTTADPVDVAVGSRIRMLRKIQGVSQQALAEEAGVTFQQIQKYERGANRVSASMLARIAGALKTPVAEMFGEGSLHGGPLGDVAGLLGEPGPSSFCRPMPHCRRVQAGALCWTSSAA